MSVSARSALEATPPIPAGYKAQDIKKVQDAKKVIKAAFSDDIPEVKLTVIEPGTQKTVESVSVVVGDARIIIDRTPNVEEFNVIVSLGEGADREVETVLKVKGRGRAQAVGQKAIEALMNARVKAKGPAIVGAPHEDAVILTPKPARTPRINGARIFGVHPGFSWTKDGKFIVISAGGVFNDTALYVALLMAAFTVLFGTRHLDATERHHANACCSGFGAPASITSSTARSGGISTAGG